MELEFLGKLGDGSFADVYECKDISLDRIVAVKFFRGATAAVSNAMDHAKALARTDHPNVVRIFALDKARDPSTKEEADCVIMERINGVSLEKRLEGPKLTLKELSELGLQLIDGLKHIHDQGLVHGDFHVENILVCDKGIKIIDILSRGTLSVLAPDKKMKRIEGDLTRLRMHLIDLFSHSELDPREATAFNQRLHEAGNIGRIRESFLLFTDKTFAEDVERLIHFAFLRMTDDHFVKGKDYASALSEETSQKVVLPLLRKVIASRAYLPKHSHYVRSLWNRLQENDEKNLISSLNYRLQEDTPGGTWWPNLRLLDLLSKKIGEKISPVVRLRLESLIVNDILSGRHDIYGGKNDSGSLGTYASSLWPLFQDKERLISNLEAMLTQNWYTQNYVGRYLLAIIPKIASSGFDRTRMIVALRAAFLNDARIIKNNLDRLPIDWVNDIKATDFDDDDEWPEYS